MKSIKRLLAKPIESVLHEAQRLTHGKRQEEYSSPEDSFTQVAEVVSAIQRKAFTAQDCAMVLVAVKLCREGFNHKRDNLTDLAGYAWVLSRINGDEGRQPVKPEG